MEMLFGRWRMTVWGGGGGTEVRCIVCGMEVLV